MRRAILHSIVLLLVLASNMQAQTLCDDLSTYPFRFAILGDRTGSHQEGIYEAVVEQVARLRPDFVMTVGDQIEGYTSDTTQMRKEWDEYFGIVNSLASRMHFTPGNHDITSDAMESTYRERIGEPYYSFDIRGMHFVILDNSRIETTEEFPSAQLDWLKQDLGANRSACYTMVFFHKPFWYRTLGSGKPDVLHDIFKANGVDAVFSGHFHTYFSAQYDDILYTAIGSSGGATVEIPEGLLYHFGWVTVDGQGIHVVPIKKDAVLSWSVQTVAEARSASGVQSSAVRFDKPLPLTEKMTLGGSDFVVTVSNPFPELVCKDTLHWNLPEGWSIEPASYPFSLAGGASTTVQFKATHANKLYPLPTLSTRLPYSQGKLTRVERTLELARTARCIKTEAPVVIDGSLNESCWKHPQTILLANDGSATTQDTAAFYFAYDQDNLYMAAYCHESKPESLHATITERDAAVYTEDAVGLMFRTSATADEAFQIYVNPLGTVSDQRLEQQSDGYWLGLVNWNGDYEVMTSRGENSYIVELRVPMSQFGAPANSGESWRVNFRRKQLRLNSAAAFQVPWQYDPRSFGVLQFE